MVRPSVLCLDGERLLTVASRIPFLRRPLVLTSSDTQLHLLQLSHRTHLADLAREIYTSTKFFSTTFVGDPKRNVKRTATRKAKFGQNRF